MSPSSDGVMVTGANVTGANKVPLFVTRFALSPRTSVGLQTMRLLGSHPDWLHFHWWSSSLRQLHPRSILFENLLLSRYSFLHNPAVVSFCERLGISYWKGGHLRPARSQRLIARFQNSVSCAYLAPLDEGDAERCLEFMNLLGTRFVLHLWDVLEGDVARGALHELILRADRVFCVSRPLLDDISKMRKGGELLYFSRDAATVSAVAPGNGPLRIVMHGDVSAYTEGLDDLLEAITILAASGVKVEVTYAGFSKVLRQANAALAQRATAVGFVRDQQAVDDVLSRGHVAFLPGPKLDPQASPRSRYSIPSRLLDYLAVGLPIVGTVHRSSATRIFLQELDLGAATSCMDGKDIAAWLLRLSGREAWQEESDASRQAFQLLQDHESPAQTLKRALAGIS